MTYEEFEWHILRMFYEESIERLRPSMLAYALGLPQERVTQYLEHAVHQGVLELDLTESGMLEYFVPGIDRSSPLPRPVWLEDKEAKEAKEAEEAAQATEVALARQATPKEVIAENGMDGSIAPSSIPVSRLAIPPNLAKHIAERYSRGRTAPMIDGQVVIDEDSMALVPYRDPDAEFMPVRVEANDEAFCDASRTMFMRQIRVYGSQPQQVIRDQVARLFQSLGYRVVDSTPDRMRFERGSIMFILALIPLFVLILPLFVYLFLYSMGRSTIHQEPLELDVQFRQGSDPEPFWDVEMTFIGKHGVVLGAADQKVLNHEIDTLREELRWALTAS